MFCCKFALNIGIGLPLSMILLLSGSKVDSDPNFASDRVKIFQSDIHFQGCISIFIIKNVGEVLRTWKKMPKIDGIASTSIDR